MKIKMKHLLALGFLCVTLSTAFFPVDPLKERIETALEDYLAHFPREKVYLQLDKDLYATGGVIWFKAYVSNDYMPSRLSTVLYAELLDKKGKVLKLAKLPIRDGGAWGNFTLSPDMAPGDYRIRAFTVWMLNFDQAFLFQRDIHIFQAGKTDSLPGKTTAPVPDFAVQFFPEGGDLVENVESLVAFKAIGQDGYPDEVSGRLTDDQGQVVDSLVTLHDGMGSFTFTPAPGRTYQAVVRDTSGLEKHFDLPPAKTDGVVLHIMRTGPGKLFFTVRRSPKDTDTYNQLNLAAEINGHLVYFAPIDFTQGYTGGMIPVSHDPCGIMQLTLFTPDGTPLAERLAFVLNGNSLLPVELHQDQTSLAPRGKNTFSLSLPDTVTGSFSVSVTDADQAMTSPSQDNIVSHLLLTSDIKGFVYNPAWYFSHRDSASEAALDLVMLTNGWRRFTWTQLLNRKYPEIKYTPETNGIEVKGQALEKQGPVKAGQISMMLRAPYDSLTYIISGGLESDGNLDLNGLNFHDTASLYYKGSDSLHKSREVTINFQPNPAETDYVLLQNPIRSPRAVPGPTLNRFLEMAQERNQVDKYISSRSILLKQVNVTATKVPEAKKTEDRYTSGMFKSDNGYTFDLTDQTLPYSNIFQYLQGRVAGLTITGDPMNPSIRWRGGNVGLFLDEIPVSADQIANEPVDDIALIKVYRPPFYGGFGGANGAIAIYSKRGGDRHFSPGAGFTRKMINGYSVAREFYSPDYSMDKKINTLPDKRATLYWNPDLLADSITHKISFSFYNTDVSTHLRVVVEGLSSDGRIARIEKEIR